MTYEYKTIPYAHQVRAEELARDRQSFAWLMEMGTGKTKVAIDEQTRLWEEKKIDAVVIFAPKGVYMNWVNTEIPTHMPDRVYENAMIVPWKAGGGTKAHQSRLAQLLDYRDGLPIFVINIEALSNGTHGYLYLTKFLSAYGRIAGYVDESTSIRNFGATRTKRMMEVAKRILYRRIMTGFVAPRSPLDLYSQFAFLGTNILGFSSYFAFRGRYAVMKQQYFGGRKVNVVVGYRDVEDLSKKITPHSYRITKDECLDLPPKIYQTREVEMTEEQQRIYRDIRENATAMLGAPKKCDKCENGYVRVYFDESLFRDEVCLTCGGIGEVAEHAVTATEVITQILRLHQVLCGHVNDEDGTSHDIPSNRIDELMDVLRETNSKTIIWARYRRDIEKIVEAISTEKDPETKELIYGPDSVVQYHGGVNDADRAKALERFQRGSARFFVGNAQTGGFGLTLTAATTVVYYSNDYDLEKRLQSEDRAHRSGQTKSVTYVDLVCKNTIDEKILQALRNKINISTAIMGDGYKEWLI